MFLLTGCSTLKPPSKTDEFWAPPKWEKTTRSDDKTWLSIRSKKIDTSKPLNLHEIIDTALKNNPAVQEALDNAAAAHMQLKQAEGSWYPQITAIADYTKDRKFANLRSDSHNTRSYGASAKADMLAMDFGGRASTVKEAYHKLIAANYGFNQTIQDVILDTEKAYYSLYSARSAFQAARDNANDAEATFFAAQDKFQAGVASRLDMLQAKANYDQSLFQLEEAKGDVETAKADLAEIMALAADTEFRIERPLWNMSMEICEKDVSELIERALEERPDIASSKADLRAREAAVRTADSDLMPTFSVGGTAEKDWTQYFGDNKAYKHFYEYTGFFKVNWNVFDGFANYARKKEAQSDVRAGQALLARDELAASADVWTKYYAYKTAFKKLEFSEAFLETSNESYDLALESYKAGLRSILDLLEAQGQLSEARSKLVQSRKDLFISVVELAHSTGSLGIKGTQE